MEFLGEEVLASWLVTRVRLPEDVSAITGNAFIVWIGDFSMGEWWVLGNENKQDYCCSEDVYLFALVRSLEVDLGRHVVECTQLGM